MTRFWFELRGRGFEIKLVFYLQPTAGWAVSTEVFYKHLKPLHLMSELHGEKKAKVWMQEQGDKRKPHPLQRCGWGKVVGKWLSD